MSIFVKDYPKKNEPPNPPPMKIQGHQPQKVSSRPEVPKGLSTGARKEMSEMYEYPVEEVRRLKQQNKEMKQLLKTIYETDALRNEDENLHDKVAKFIKESK